MLPYGIFYALRGYVDQSSIRVVPETRMELPA
jgi:hypothetical protein